MCYRCMVDLVNMDREKTHSIKCKLDDGAGSLHFLLTISGTTASETISDLTTHEENSYEKEQLLNRYVSILILRQFLLYFQLVEYPERHLLTRL